MVGVHLQETTPTPGARSLKVPAGRVGRTAGYATVIRTAVGGRDNYPQTVTMKYRSKHVEDMIQTERASPYHGAGIQQSP